jgi:hypothetical protein
MSATVTAETSGAWDTATVTGVVSTPAGTDGQRQLLVLAFSNGSAVSAPTITGWTLEGQNHIATRQNRMATYTRVVSGTATAGAISVGFSATVEANFYCASVSGTVGTPSVSTDTSWLNDRVIPANTATANNSLHMVAIATASYPRTIRTVTGYTEAVDAYQFTGDGSIGLGLHVLRRSGITAGAVSSISVPMYDYTNTTTTGDQTVYMNVVYSPFVTSVGEGNFTVTAEWPVPSVITPIRTTGGDLAVGATDVVTVTVQDQYGDAIRNATVAVGAASGGVYTVATVPATNTAGASVFTITGAVAGTAALVPAVGPYYGDQIDVTVTQAVSNKIRRRRVRIWG